MGKRRVKTKQYYIVIKYIEFKNVGQSINHIFEGVKKSTILYHLFHKKILLYTFYRLLFWWWLYLIPFYFDRYAEFFQNISMYLHVSILSIAITSIPPFIIYSMHYYHYIMPICTLGDAAICWHTYSFHFSVNIHTTRTPVLFSKWRKIITVWI